MLAMHRRSIELPAWTLAHLATGVLLLDAAGCRRPSADVSSPESVEPTTTAKCPEGAASRPAAQPGSSDDREAPRIVAGRFVSRERVQLRFSESIEPPKQVNPRQFRLSEGYSLIDYGGGYGGSGYAHAYYYDLAARSGYADQPLVFVGVEPTSEPDVLELVLSRPIPVSLCEDLKYRQESYGGGVTEGPPRRFQIGLFLHYTGRGSVGIRDLAGNPMADMGGEWALHFGTRNINITGTPPLVRFDLLVELPCPDANLPGFDAPPGPS